MQTFELTLKNEKKKFYDRFALFLFVMSSAGVLALLFYTKSETISKNSFYLLLGFAVVMMIWPTILVSRKKTHYAKVFLGASLAICGYWVLLGYWWVGLIILLLTLLYTMTRKELKVRVGLDKIIYPSFPVRIIEWSNLNNLVLKDGLLTIDFKNNKLIQQPTDVRNSINEKEFNEFCKEQLRTAKTSTV